jgi:hypothetical protein
MKTVLKISTILSWFNLIVWGFIVLMLLLMGLGFQQLFFFIFAFLFCVNILHNYAALQLHKSIKDPTIPLSNQTPVGIRFIGMITAFVGIIYFTQGAAILQSPHEVLQMMESQVPQAKGKIPLSAIHLIGAFSLILGISLTLNVLLNFRLLRWYHFMKGMM